ncbi:glycosyltransferase family 4 protein [Candidatus Peregrinibacteria bacterium]|nr:glycosyltransferase family 4 protein [Candidatus Peregrinibacteria bacterium]
MRIALFSSTVDAIDGYGTITYELSRHLHERGIGITLFLPRSQREIVERLHLPFSVRCELPPYIYRVTQPAVLQHLRRVDVSACDLVHDLFAFPHCLVSSRSARKYGTPYLMGAQGTHGVRPLTFFPEKQLLKRCYRQARRIVVPSAFTRQKILEYAGETYPIDIIHNGVNFGRFSKAPVSLPTLQEQYRGKKILLTVGGLWARKGHDLVLRALPSLVQSHLNLLYLIIGEGNARAGLEALARELGVRDHVAFLGYKTGDELVAHFHVCDVYVHTPRVTGLKFEGFGIVYLEASASGKPIVATDAGGVHDAVVDGSTGFVVRDGDVPAIASSIERLLTDGALRASMGERGRRYAEEHDWASIAAHFEELYDAILHG